MSKIKLKASEVNEFNSKLEKTNKKFEAELKSVVSEIKAVVGDSSILYSEVATASFIAYINQIETSFVTTLSNTSGLSKAAVDTFITGIEAADKAC